MNYIGIDIGSISVKAVLTNESHQVIKEQYMRHHGQTIEYSLKILNDILQKISENELGGIAVTGNGGSIVAELLDAYYINEVIAQSKAMGKLHPEIRSVIEIGGEDAKLIKIGQDRQGKGIRLKDFSMNTVCAAGTGSFLDQQAQRLGVSIENEFGTLAVTSKHPPRIAGRCSVFAKSDMIHLQQSATPVADILMGLCLAMARNFKSNVAKGAELEKPVSFQGGVAANAGMVKAFEQVLGLNEGELFIPPHHRSMGAIGAVLSMIESGKMKPFKGLDSLKTFDSSASGKQNFHEPLHDTGFEYDVEPEPLKGPFPVDVFLGVDIGSISTNLVLLDREKRVVARKYLMTAGNPLEAVKQGLAEIGDEMGDRVTVKGVTTTGSGRFLVGDFIGADVVKNEITAHARGAVNVRPDVDTIFEIGGQDSKYISLQDGAVVDFTMNKVCAAGTGSFLEEQAEKLGVSIKGEFSKLALGSKAPAMLGERCTVFMESSLNKQQQTGTPKADLVAGLSYSIVKNYLSTVVGDRKVGDVILFQGGTAYNRAVKAAFEKECGKTIIVPPHHDVLGALGCALIAMENEPEAGSRFKGFDLAKRKLEVDSFVCEDCSNSCEIRTVSVEGELPLKYGSRCGKFDEEKRESLGKDLPDLFGEREKMLMSAYTPSGEPKPHSPVVAIPRSLLFYEMFPFWNTFFSELGFKVITSPVSSKRIINQGCEAVVEEVCFPVKVGLGHTIELLKKEPDYLFLPCVVNAEPIHKDSCGSSVCPLVQGFPYMSDAALDFSQYKAKVLRPVFHFENNDVKNELQKFARQLGFAGAKVKKVIEMSFDSLHRFRASLLKRGDEVLASLPAGKPNMVIVSRPYNGCDTGLNLRIPQKLKEMGILAIPVDFLPITNTTSEHLKTMYWRYGQRILSAAHVIATDPRLFGLYITNFACGPDSFIIKYFEKVMKGKPMLPLELDEHSADAGVITRLEAFLDSLESSPAAGVTLTLNGNGLAAKKDFSGSRKIYIPHIDDHGRGVAAAVRYYGIESEAMPMSDEKSLEHARRHITGKECYPFMITAGDILKRSQQNDFEPSKAAFFMPTTNGPCRFGQYCHSHQLILDEAGLGEAQMITIDQATSFDSDLKMLDTGFRKLIWQVFVATDNIKKMLFQTRPYEIIPGESDRIYQECIRYLENIVENKGKLGDSGKYAKKLFSKVQTVKTQQRPLIGIIGEIYVRSNEFSNNFIIRRIEELGGEVVAPTFHEWILYTDWERRADHLRKGEYAGYAKELIQSFVQKYYTRRETEPLRNVVENFLYEMPTDDLMKLSDDYLTENLRGEATLSMARAEEYARHGFNGVVNLTPFHCMPGTIANTLLVRFAKKYPNVPVLKMVYDGTQQSGEDTRLEAFMFQAKQLVEG
jgi:predicted CoA-substrate-specific enzyme activase